MTTDWFRPTNAPCRIAFRIATLLALSLAPITGASAGVSLSYPDGFWASPAPPFQRDHAVVHVPDRDLLVSIAYREPPGNGAEAWALPLATPDAWIRLASPGPDLGFGTAAVYDPVEQQIIVHGGRLDFPRTWAMRIEPVVEWRELVPAGYSPGARWDHTMVYDARHERVILHGGRNRESLLGDTWELRLRGPGPLRWTLLRTNGVGPGARAGHAAVYDPAGKRMLVFGAGDTDEGSDAWELALQGKGTARWRRIAMPGGPAASRTQHTLARDPASGHLFLHGGVDGDGVAQRDVWEASFEDAATWSRLNPAGSVAPTRSEHVALIDPARSRMIVGGGVMATPGANETWSLALAGDRRWDRLAPMAPLSAATWGTTSRLVGAFDRAHGRMMLVQSRSNEDVGRTWLLDFAPNPRWSRLFDPPIQNTDICYDALHERMLLHGGLDAQNRRTSSTWELAGDLSAGYRLLPQAAGAEPAPRSDHLVLHDTRRDRMIVHGGSAAFPNCGLSLDTHLLTLSEPVQWSIVQANPFPEGGGFPSGVYDEANDRIVLHGGSFGCRFPTHPSGSRTDGTWSLDLGDPGAWRLLSPPGVGPLGMTDAAYDPVDQRMVAIRHFEEVWTFNLEPGQESWRGLAPRGQVPAIKQHAALVYDPGRDRFVMVDSDGVVTYLLPSRGSEPVARRHAGEVPPATPEPAGAVKERGLSLHVRSNPIRGSSLALVLELPADGPGRVDLLDVRGRVVAVFDVAAGARGDHQFPLGDRAPGVYFVRLSQGAARSIEKFVIVR